MINHGVSTGALFLLVGMIYERRHTRMISELKGIQQVAPIFAAVFTLVMLSSIGVPGLNGFVGEFLVLIGSFLTARWWTVVAATGVIIAALYLLWAYQRVFHGEPDEANKSFRELSLREGLVMLRCSGSSCSAVSTRSRCSTGSSRASTRSSRTSRTRRATNSRSPWLFVARGSHADRGGRRVMFAQAADFVGPSDRLVGALSPLLVLLGGGLLLLVAAALTPHWPRGSVRPRHRRHRRRRGGAGGVRLGRRERRPRGLPRRRRAALRPLRHVHHDHDLRRRARRRAARRRLPPPRGIRRAGGLRAVPHVRHRWRRDGCGQRPDRAVPRARDAVDRAVRARRIEPSPGRVAGVGPQVLRPRRLLVGVLPLRHRTALRRDGHHAPDVVDPDARLSIFSYLRDNVFLGEKQSLLLAGIALLLVGLGVQDRRRAVPHVDARRLPGRAVAGHRVHGVGGQGRRVRGAAAGAHVRPGRSPGRLAAGDLGRRGPHARRRLDPRGRADQREADARLLLDQPRRVHPRRGRSGVGQGHLGRRSSTCWPTPCSCSARSASSRSSAAPATPTTSSTTTAGSASSARSSRSPSRCSCSPRPACRSRRASSPSSA